MTDTGRPADGPTSPVRTDAPVRPVEVDQEAVQGGDRAADQADQPDDRAGREPGEMVLALSPRQIIGGFAVLAGLIVLLRRRGRDRG